MPNFRLRWRGYDPEEVDEYLKKMVTDQRRLEERLAKALDSRGGDGPRVGDTPADDEPRTAEIQAQAIETAERIIQDAGEQTRLLHFGQLDAGTQTIERLSSLEQSLSSIERRAAALRQFGDLFADRTGGEERNAPRAPETATSRQPHRGR